MGFWDKALTPNAPVSSAPQPVTTTEPWFRQTAIPSPKASIPATPHVEEPPAPVKAQSARSSETCPDCGSGNFFKPQGHPNAMSQCYECGWNPRFAHSTAGAGMPTGDGGPATPARQVSTTGNYNPQTIVGHIG